MLSIIETGALSSKTLGTVRMLQQDYASGFTGKVAVAGTTEDAWLAFSIQPMAPGPSLPKPSAPPLPAPLPPQGDPPSNGTILRPR